MLGAKNVKAAGSYSALRINFTFPQGVKLNWGILGMYATKPEENGFFFFFLQGYEFYMKLGALHYISAVLTLHAKYIVYGALTKDVWEDKNTEFTSEMECFGPLKSSFRIWFQKTYLDVGCKWN